MQRISTLIHIDIDLIKKKIPIDAARLVIRFEHLGHYYKLVKKFKVKLKNRNTCFIWHEYIKINSYKENLYHDYVTRMNVILVVD
jgi:hypothetical protein